MHIPKTGEQVFVIEYHAMFRVANTYHETRTADLLPLGSGSMKEDVPWRKLFRCWSSPVETINMIPVWRH
jgi:hypothetical protein